METYRGVKFSYHQCSPTCPAHPLLPRLNRWAYLFSELGLTPVHPLGAYGNQSIRTEGGAFIITRTGMQPVQDLALENYTLVERFDQERNAFLTHGVHPPSSECFLHSVIYRECGEIQAILHGHSRLLNTHASALTIPTTDTFHEYGTMALAQSALTIMKNGCPFFILKDHGFVATGPSLDEAGMLTLKHYSRLLALLRQGEPF